MSRSIIKSRWPVSDAGALRERVEMTTSVICTQCGARNLATQAECRRCKAPLGEEVVVTATVRGTPTSTLLQERWAVLGLVSQAEGVRWQAGHDVERGRPVMIQLHPGDPGALREVEAQARSFAELSHSGLLEVLGVVPGEEGVSVVLDWPPGGRLDELLAARERVPLWVALALMQDLLEALRAMHGAGYRHGRLDASRVLVRERIDGRLGAALSGVWLGPNAPELAEDYRALARIVVQMLGVTEQGTEADLAGLLLRDVGGRAGEEVSVEVAGLLARMLAQDAAHRLINPREILAQIDALCGSLHDETMCAVEAGPFLRGSRDDDPAARREELPMSSVELSAFYIDRDPVSAAQFHRFATETGLTLDEEWYQFNAPRGAGELPVVHVTWREAYEYAHWAGKRLPTEAEWEKAARGTDGRTYPWGDAPPNAGLALYGENPAPGVPGERSAGRSPYGVEDMAGNVFEWVADWYDGTYYNEAPPRDPGGPRRGTRKVLRGGSFAHPEFALRCATRGRYEPGERRANHSFRCVWSLRDPQPR
ncbi:hypothetical protein EA187_13975 [Lujinxingia sediminis]|uniref:Protein kinase domain-containing protein n=1 Tax=Lujinxingia sediminis TaxID=2480984 RepID=A0ABY0CQZ1_9DELT|nr:SUMF1/EgtB/PvdO family nonheme iron enzyme [Lujinxingia sediminis]RVU42941.1 hypothetical protein EA187_13975 [Lujinxingia sediminis]